MGRRELSISACPYIGRIGNLLQHEPKLQSSLFSFCGQTLEGAVDDLAQCFGGIGILFQRLSEDSHLRVGIAGVSNHLSEEFKFVAKVIFHQRDVGSRHATDLANCRALVPVFGEHPNRGSEQLVPRVLGDGGSSICSFRLHGDLLNIRLT